MSVARYHRLSNWVPHQSLDKVPFTQWYDLILIIMNIYENMRNKRTLVEKIRGGGVLTLAKCQLLTVLDYQTRYQIKVET